MNLLDIETVLDLILQTAFIADTFDQESINEYQLTQGSCLEAFHALNVFRGLKVILECKKAFHQIAEDLQ